MARRAERWVVITWAVLVAAGGGATLWLDEATPDAPVERVELESVPTRSPSTDVGCSPPPHIAEEDSDTVYFGSCLETVVPAPPAGVDRPMPTES